jgi:hypothetical protein
MPEPGRFPTPWTVQHNDDAYWVEAANGARFGFVYFRDVQTTPNPSYHTEDDARRLVTNFARLPELLKS